MAFTYQREEGMDFASPWLVVAYTELGAKTVVFILFEVYDSRRLWALSCEMIEGIRSLNLRSVLGNSGKDSEFCRLLDSTESS